MTKKQTQTIIFFVALCVVSAYFFYIIRFFTQPIFYAILLAVFSYPIYRFILKKCQCRPGLSAFITIVLLIVFIFIPIGVIMLLLIRDSFILYTAVENKGLQILGGIPSRLGQWQIYMPKIAQTYFESVDWRASLVAGIQQIAQYVFVQLQRFTANLLQVFGMLFIMLFALYYMYKDGPRWYQWLIKISPLNNQDEKLFVNRFLLTAKSTLVNTMLVGCIQGCLIALAFWFLGLTAPIFWGLVAFFFAVLPVVGVPMVWGPAAVMLWLRHETGPAIFLALYGVLIVGLIDNVLRPILVSKSSKLHPLVVLISTFGGLAVFGFSGFILGPIIASLAKAIWEIYEKRYI